MFNESVPHYFRQKNIESNCGIRYCGACVDDMAGSLTWQPHLAQVRLGLGETSHLFAGALRNQFAQVKPTINTHTPISFMVTWNIMVIYH